MLTQAATLRAGPSDEAEALLELKPGDRFAILDNSLDWAWGYAGKQRRVGYVRADRVDPLATVTVGTQQD